MIDSQKKIPYYSEHKKCWEVKIDNDITEGDIYWCVSEYIQDCLFYKFADGDHAHGFDGVLEKIINNPGIKDIEGDRTQYSKQELRIIDKLKQKISEDIDHRKS